MDPTRTHGRDKRGEPCCVPENKRERMDSNVHSGRAPRPSTSFRLRNRGLDSLRLRRVFDLFDGNGDGELTVDELRHALHRLGLNDSTSDLASAVGSFIKPGRCGLDFDDFQNLHRSLGDDLFGDLSCADEAAETAEEDLSEAFKVFDVDGDGYITARELQEVLGKLGFAEGAEIARVENMIVSFDRNCDGRVDFGEFKHMMRSFSIKGACG